MQMYPRVLLSFFIPLLFSSCGDDPELASGHGELSSNENSFSESLSYELTENDCPTGRHTFSSLKEYCDGLKDDALNNFCAKRLRRTAFEARCSGDFDSADSIAREPELEKPKNAPPKKVEKGSVKPRREIVIRTDLKDQVEEVRVGDHVFFLSQKGDLTRFYYWPDLLEFTEKENGEKKAEILTFKEGETGFFTAELDLQESESLTQAKAELAKKHRKIQWIQISSEIDGELRVEKSPKDKRKESLFREALPWKLEISGNRNKAMLLQLQLTPAGANRLGNPAHSLRDSIQIRACFSQPQTGLYRLVFDTKVHCIELGDDSVQRK